MATMRGLIFVAVVLALLIVWWRKQVTGKRRLAEIDEGRRCISCDSTDTEVRAGWVRCNRCLHTADLSTLRSAQVTAAELANLTQPEDPRKFR